jgi:hypothetical protein
MQVAGLSWSESTPCGTERVGQEQPKLVGDEPRGGSAPEPFAALRDWAELDSPKRASADTEMPVSMLSHSGQSRASLEAPMRRVTA